MITLVSKSCYLFEKCSSFLDIWNLYGCSFKFDWVDDIYNYWIKLNFVFSAFYLKAKGFWVFKIYFFSCCWKFRFFGVVYSKEFFPFESYSWSKMTKICAYRNKNEYLFFFVIDFCSCYILWECGVFAFFKFKICLNSFLDGLITNEEESSIDDLTFVNESILSKSFSE